MNDEIEIADVAETPAEESPSEAPQPEESLASNSSLKSADSDDAAESPTVIVQAAESSAASVVTSVTIDDREFDASNSGLAKVIHDVFGVYTVQTQEVSGVHADGTAFTYHEPVPGLAGLDWYWLSGVFIFCIAFLSLFRLIGVLAKR